MYRKWSTLVLLSLVTPLLALAQNTGKLTGTVTDNATGESLPGVTITIEGTTLGAVTDVDGVYTILGVPVGTYTVRAEYTGYNPGLFRGVDINSGYTRTLNFRLREGAEAEEIIVDYERPLIQNDALGTPRVATGEQITNLPVRGVAAVAALQAGVTNNEGSGTLNVRGGRGSEVVYYVDGVKVVGSLGVSQSAIQEQEMLIGGLPAKYGDAMAGVISVTTKNGSNRFFGTIDAVTSQALDAYGYSSAQAALGGPIMGAKLGFFVSGEIQNFDDQSPSAIKIPQVRSSRLAEIMAAPQVVRVTDASGNVAYRPIPADLPAGATLASVLQPGDVVSRTGLASSFRNAAELLTAEDFTTAAAKPNNQQNGLNLQGKLNFAPVQSIRLAAGGQYITRYFDSFAIGRSLFNNDANTRNEQFTSRGFLTWSHYLGQKTFYQIQADLQDFKAYSHDPRFGRDLNDVIFYQDYDNDANAIARAYRTPVNNDLSGDVSPDSVLLDYQYSDNSLPSSSGLYTLYALPGANNNGYAQSRTQQWRVSGNAQTQLGLHLIEFGGEYEQRTMRAFSIGSGTLAYLARRYSDDNPEIAGQGFTSYDQLTYTDLKNRTGYYGYNYNGTKETDGENLAGFSAADDDAGAEAQIAPLQPIYYAGYISDKIEYRDIVLQIGVRADVYDSNQRVLRDPYSLLPIVRAGDVSLSTDLIGSDFAVYYNGNTVAGFRDTEGRFYNTQGQVVTPNAVISNSAVTPRLADGATLGVLDERAFEDFKPEAIFQPRIGVTFPVTDRALFYAHYDVLAQRPTTNQFATLADYQSRLAGSGGIGNPNLQPQKTTEYELGFRQRLGERAAIQMSGFYRQIDNLIQLRALKNVYPGNYSTYRNVDFGTVKGVEFEFDLRRTNNIELNANYTLSFAEGTGSDANTTSNIFWLREASPFVPNFLSPLDFDRRHTVNLAIDYRLGENEGPTIGGAKLLENFGVNLIGSFKSGQPYSKLQEPYNFTSAVRLTGLQGEINGQNLPASTLLNLKVDRRFNIGTRRSLTAYLEVENLLDTDNVVGVWGATGLPDDDGYLATTAGQQEYPIGSLERDLYRNRLNATGNYGIPRQTRLGVRLNF